jgi:hypothetical protein
MVPPSRDAIFGETEVTLGGIIGESSEEVVEQLGIATIRRNNTITIASFLAMEAIYSPIGVLSMGLVIVLL